MRGLKFWRVYSLLLLAIQFMWFTPPSRVMAQQPTVDVPTVTGTPPGPMLTVHPGWEEQINVRGGPGYDYEPVGILVIGQWAPAIGQTSSGEWIQIAYLGAPDNVGWVLGALVDMLGEFPPIVEVPPTPTPRTTPTIDPTLAAQYIVEVPPTRLPTFTPPAPLAIPTFPSTSPEQSRSGVPMGLVIIGLGVIGMFGAMISLLRGR